MPDPRTRIEIEADVVGRGGGVAAYPGPRATVSVTITATRSSYSGSNGFTVPQGIIATAVGEARKAVAEMQRGVNDGATRDSRREVRAADRRA